MIILSIKQITKFLNILQKSSNHLKYYEIGDILPCNYDLYLCACVITKYDTRINTYSCYVYLINIYTFKVIDCLYIETFSKEFIEECGCPNIPLVLHNETIYITWEQLDINGKRLNKFRGWPNIEMKTVTINSIKQYNVKSRMFKVDYFLD